MGWPFPAQLAGAFAAVGARVEALSPAGAMLARSCHPERHHLYSALGPMDCLADAVRDAKPDMVMACDDLAARLVAQMEGTSVPGRLELVHRAGQAGAPAAMTEELAHEHQLGEVINRLGLPLVLKSDHSWGGEGVIIAEDRQEAAIAFRRLVRHSRLRNIFRLLRGRGSHFLTQALYPVAPRISAQRFIAGLPATSSIACWRGQVVAAHHFDVLLSTTPTSPASVLVRSDCAQMESAAHAVASAFHLSGLFGLDYIRDHDGRVHLLEMNGRATPTTHLALSHDLPASLLKAAGYTAYARAPVTDKREIALFPREWLRDPASPWLTRAYHDVPWDDPEVLRTCVRGGSRGARALLEKSQRRALTAGKPVLGRK
jgi:hypothetical protein